MQDENKENTQSKMEENAKFAKAIIESWPEWKREMAYKYLIGGQEG